MDLNYEISTMLLVIGYTLFILGISSHDWKYETGYDYGLWYRCDKRECVFYKVDYFGLVTYVRIGVLISALLLIVSASCLLTEVAMVIFQTISRHKRRLGIAVTVTTIMAEITTSVCLAFYGYKTLMGNKKLPALGWGFGATGSGIITFILGTILRIMGPTSTWNNIPLLTKSSQNIHDKRTIYKPKKQGNINNKTKNKPNRFHSSKSKQNDTPTYRKASDSLSYRDGSCENLLLLNRQDSTCSSPGHKYEEIAFGRNAMFTQRDSQKLWSTSSNQPSPRLVRDLSPKKSSSLPPGISPGFYAQVHRNSKHRRENKYETTNRDNSSLSRRHHFENMLTASPRIHSASSSPFRPIQVLTIDNASFRSVPIPTPPPSPPLPPPPPPIASPTRHTVNIRRMNSVDGGGCGGNDGSTIMVDYAPSPVSMHSFGSYGY